MCPRIFLIASDTNQALVWLRRCLLPRANGHWTDGPSPGVLHTQRTVTVYKRNLLLFIVESHPELNKRDTS